MTAIESMPIAVILWLMFAVVISGFFQGVLGIGFPFIATDPRTALGMAETHPATNCVRCSPHGMA